MASNLSPRIARSIAAALAAIALATAGCGATHKEAVDARSSLYDADFALVYSAAVASVRALYPDFKDDPTAGKISTVWHQVKYSDPGADDPKSQQVSDRANGVNATGAAGQYGAGPSAARRTNFIRFDVTVTGGRPWRVRVRGAASQLVPGNALQPSCAAPTSRTGWPAAPTSWWSRSTAGSRSTR